MKKIYMLLAGLIWLASTHLAAADEVQLVFATVAPPNVNFVVDVLHPWAENINRVGKGVVHIDVRDGMSIATNSNYYDRVMDNVIQIAWGTQSSIGGKFLRSSVAGLPFIADSAEDASVALWRLSQSKPMDADYSDIVPLFLVALPQARLHLTKSINSVDDFQGLKILTTSKITSEAVADLGGTPLAVISADMYSMLQRSAANGVIVNWAALDVFKLAEVTAYHIDAPLGGSTGMVMMSRKRLNALPPAVQSLLLENSGEAWSRKYGAFWDKAAAQTRAEVQAAHNHTIVTLSPEERASWQNKVLPVINDWVRNTPDGAQVLDEFRRELGKH